MVKDRILVSACLLGQPVRYNGKGLPLASSQLVQWQDEGRLIALCPEVSAGFPTPRPPAEITANHDGADIWLGRGQIVEDNGCDVTQAFVEGARIAVQVASKNQCRFALLTDGSPSCGSSFIYSGLHDGVRRSGIGVVTAALRDAGVQVFAQHQVNALAAKLDQ